jgi:hypothetical protein
MGKQRISWLRSPQKGMAMYTLPSSIHATRIGRYLESEYDSQGRLAPVTWICNCGYHFPTEVLEYEDDDDYYVPVSHAAKTQFLAEHVACTAKCYKCGVTPVNRYGYWCASCEEAAGY